MTSPGDMLGLTGSVRRVVATLVDVGRTRVELAATELVEERQRIAHGAWVASGVLLCLGNGVVLGVLALAWWAGPERGPWVLAASAMLLLIAAGFGVVHLIASRRKVPLLHDTLAQLRADADALAPERSTA